jgi:hypothetical protein
MNQLWDILPDIYGIIYPWDFSGFHGIFIGFRGV